MEESISPRPDAIRTVPPKGAVPAVLRAARLLETLASAREPLSLVAIAERLGLPRSSVHGLCATLVATGLATRFDNGTYHLGSRVLDLAQAYLARTDLTGEFSRVLQAADPIPEESVVLSVLDGPDIVYVACRSGTRPFGFSLRIGMRLPANCTASGKALLASLDDEQVDALAQAGRLYGLTERSITDPAELKRELALVRKRGYAVDTEETRKGIVCFGAPVHGSTGRTAVAAVGISMPKIALDAAQRAKAIRAVREVAEALSKRLGAAAS
ncbi:MAG TPA: IclR family transcriptional regulator [Quisquiliibacterium sp.]|nr:IclR family transcriptional regulator [Quisquiliibacterium sp.]